NENQPVDGVELRGARERTEASTSGAMEVAHEVADDDRQVCGEAARGVRTIAVGTDAAHAVRREGLADEEEEIHPPVVRTGLARDEPVDRRGEHIEKGLPADRLPLAETPLERVPG